MAHLLKMTRQAVVHMFAHYEHTYDRDNVDKELSHLNEAFTFREDEKTDKEFLDDRLSELTFRHQKNNVVMCSWVITLPEDYRGNSHDFFEGCGQFVGERYGCNNVVGCWVHRDEPGAREHIHIAFIPAYKDKEGVERLSSNVVNRNDLKTFHQDLEKYLEHERGIHCHLLNGKTKENHERVCEQDYMIQYLENHLAKYEPDYFDKMQKYVNKEMELDRAVREAESKEREIERNREYEHTR